MPRTIHSDTYRTLVGRLAAARRRAALTQHALAERLGKPQSYVAKVEGLERRLDVVEFLEMAREIGVDPMPLLRQAWKTVGGP